MFEIERERIIEALKLIVIAAQRRLASCRSLRESQVLSLSPHRANHFGDRSHYYPIRGGPIAVTLDNK